MDGFWLDGPTVVKVTEMAVDHIHAHKSMLPGHRLRFSWVNTQVSGSNYKQGCIQGDPGITVPSCAPFGRSPNLLFP